MAENLRYQRKCYHFGVLAAREKTYKKACFFVLAQRRRTQPPSATAKPSWGWLRVGVRKPRLVLAEFSATWNKVTATPRSYWRGCRGNFCSVSRVASRGKRSVRFGRVLGAKNKATSGENTSKRHACKQRLAYFASAVFLLRPATRGSSLWQDRFYERLGNISRCRTSRSSLLIRACSS